MKRKYHIDGVPMTAEEYEAALRAKYGYKGKLPKMTTAIHGKYLIGDALLPANERPTEEEYDTLLDALNELATEKLAAQEERRRS